MTIRAQHSEILEAMVVADAIAMVDLDGDGATPPFIDTAFVAAILK